MSENRACILLLAVAFSLPPMIAIGLIALNNL